MNAGHLAGKQSGGELIGQMPVQIECFPIPSKICYLPGDDLEYPVFMNATKAYEEVIDFIASGTTPKNVIAFRPSEAAQERVSDLLRREKRNELTGEENSELEHYMQLEHLMRLAKARARDFLVNE